MDDPGLDPGAPWAPPVVEPVQRPRSPAGLQLAVGGLQPPVPHRVSRTGTPRFHRPGDSHPADWRDGDVRAGPGDAARRDRGGHGGHCVRAERIVHGRARLAHRLGHVVVGLAARPRSWSSGAATAAGTWRCSPSSWRWPSTRRTGHARRPDRRTGGLRGRRARDPRPPLRGEGGGVATGVGHRDRLDRRIGPGRSAPPPRLSSRSARSGGRGVTPAIPRTRSCISCSRRSTDWRWPAVDSSARWRPATGSTPPDWATSPRLPISE